MADFMPGATQRPGPTHKSGGYAAGNEGPKRGAVVHSMVGFYAGALSGLDSAVQKSWHFSILYHGEIVQHYSRQANTWHANDSDSDGGVRANIDLVGIEMEGGPPGNESEPLTSSQFNALVSLLRWCAEQEGLGALFSRYPNQALVFTLAEHKEVGNSPTACPSNRIPWGAVLTMLNAPIAPELPTADQVSWAAISLAHGYRLNRLAELHPFDRDVLARALRHAENYPY